MRSYVCTLPDFTTVIQVQNFATCNYFQLHHQHQAKPDHPQIASGGPALMYLRGVTGAMPGDVQTNLNSITENGLLCCKIDPLTDKCPLSTVCAFVVF